MSFAAFRKSEPHIDLGKLAEEHMKHDLTQDDRDALIKASSRVTVPAVIGTIAGLGLGIYAAFRLRRIRTDLFGAFRATEKPTHVVFADGRRESIPDVTRFIQPTRYGDIAAYFFFGLGGTILGGELGLLLGTWSASRAIRKDEARRKRIEVAYRRFKADYLRREADQLESGAPLPDF
ncbi:uncharacterized protein GGS25DRAFT_519972 [Hypoxylon fragiforme]|uniref:uncharacterized protein n=1 Tax=Hypoxylon fragiforme TaxID=63214 RepID=UPI0020C5C89A|nr:uncharacterized protein GGS25DRAFT_519972 [Hypoxylon fragiforme]KAI2611660.1 hypothetical protein GGS25DRAFT_519972 [Hypoxylon fragiforme]